MKVTVAILSLMAGAIPPFTSAAAQTGGTGPQPTTDSKRLSQPNPAAAASGDQGLQDIIVTAERTSSRLQTTPIAVTALNADALKSLGVTGLDSLANVVPGLSFGQELGQAHITIRGVGTDSVTPGGDPRVAYYQDGVYIARPTAQVGGLYDIEQLQVLKGPQGTLYGRNATGGALVVTSQRPTRQAGGYANFSYGNHNTVEATGAAGGAIGSNLAARLSGTFKYHDGYGRNILTGNRIDGEKTGGARLSLLWSPSDTINFLTIGDYHREKDSAR